MDLITVGEKNRFKAATKMNMESSRSHCIFKMKVLAENEATDDGKEGCLYLVDLAGCEKY